MSYDILHFLIKHKWQQIMDYEEAMVREYPAKEKPRHIEFQEEKVNKIPIDDFSFSLKDRIDEDFNYSNLSINTKKIKDHLSFPHSQLKEFLSLYMERESNLFFFINKKKTLWF